MEGCSGLSGGGWVAAGAEGQQRILMLWQQREEALRKAVGCLWKEHCDAFASYWRSVREPEVKTAMLLASLHDLLSVDDEEDNATSAAGEEDDPPEGGSSPMSSLVAVACPELQDIPRLVASPAEELLTLLAEPYARSTPPQQDKPTFLLQEPPPSKPAEAEQPAGSAEKEALARARCCCLMQMGCNLLLLSVAAMDDTLQEE